MGLIQNLYAGRDAAAQQRREDAALEQQKSVRDIEMERARLGLEQSKAAMQTESAERERAKRLNISTGLLRGLEIAKRTGNKAPLQGYWSQVQPYLQQQLGDKAQLTPEWNDSYETQVYKMHAALGGELPNFAQPQANSDFLRAVQILEDPNAPPEIKDAAQRFLGQKAKAGAEAITPYQQAQLDIERKKLGAKTEAEAGKAGSAVSDKIKTATGIARAKQGYGAIDAARSSLATLDELEASMSEGAQFGPVAGRLPSYSGATQRGETAFAKLGLANVKALPGPATDKDVAFIKSANLNPLMDNKTLARLIPEVRAAAERVIEKNMRINAMIEQGVSPSEAEAEVWGASKGPGLGIAAPQPTKTGPSISNW